MIFRVWFPSHHWRCYTSHSIWFADDIRRRDIISQKFRYRRLAEYSVHLIIGSALAISGISDTSSTLLLTKISQSWLNSLIVGSHYIVVLVIDLPNFLCNSTRFEAASNITCNFVPNLKSDVANIALPTVIRPLVCFRVYVNCFRKTVSTISKSSTSLIHSYWIFNVELCPIAMLSVTSKNNVV